MDAIQAKNKDDRQKQSEETMKLYKEAGVNPFGGCAHPLPVPGLIGSTLRCRARSICVRHRSLVGSMTFSA